MTQSLSPEALNNIIESSHAPVVFDVRKKPAFDSDPRMLPSASWQIHDEVDAWAKDLSKDSQVIVYCVHGHAISQNAAKALRDLGFNAQFLDGGIAGWTEAGYAVS